MPIYKKIITDDTQLNRIQDNIAAAFNPTVTNQPVLLKAVPLVSGLNKINHTLGRNLQGWSIRRQRSAATFYDTQDSNPNPNLTLWLVSSAAVVVDIEVM
jgi:hypothetical protein